MDTFEPEDGCYVEDCWNCGGQGYRELYDEDPLWYDKDEVEMCEICQGKGFYYLYEDDSTPETSKTQPPQPEQTGQAPTE